MHGNFARLRLEYVALYADYIAQIVILFKGRVIFFAHVVAAHVNLDKSVIVLQVTERRLAHNAAGHKSARDTHFLILERREIFAYIRRARGYFVLYLYERVFVFVRQLLQLFAAYTRLFGKLLFLFFRG